MSRKKQIRESISTALLLDESGKNAEAFIQYLCCMDLISLELREAIVDRKMGIDVPSILSIASQCIGRCQAIYDNHPHLFNPLLIGSLPAVPNFPLFQQQQGYGGYNNLPNDGESSCVDTAHSSRTGMLYQPTAPLLPSPPPPISNIDSQSYQQKHYSHNTQQISSLGAVDARFFHHQQHHQQSQTLPSSVQAPVTPYPQLSPAYTPPQHSPSQQMFAQSSNLPPSSLLKSSSLYKPLVMLDESEKPVIERLSQEEHEQLNKQFSAISKGEEIISIFLFSEALGNMFDRSGWTSILFSAFDFNNSGSIEMSDFKYCTAVLIHGNIQERTDFAFRMFDKNGKGYISRDDFVTVVQCSYNLLECLGLDIEILCNTELINQLFTQLFQECDMDKDGRINKSEFQIMVSKKSCLLHGLGIIKPVANYEQLRKMGPPVSFGHYSFARVLYMMCGIKSAHENLSAMTINQYYLVTHKDYSSTFSIDLPNIGIPLATSGVLMSLGSSEEIVSFTDYAPFVFYHIRKWYRISEELLLQSFSPEQVLGHLVLGQLTTLSEKITDGRSGNFFFSTHNGNFMAKTISSGELNTFLKILPNYYEYIIANPETLLCRYYGLYKMNNIPFIIMGNVFESSTKIPEVYDLKGSTVGRSNPGEGVKKDLDFTSKRKYIKLDGTLRKQFIQQLEKDAKFLESLSIIDYSLLLGIAPRDKNVTAFNPQKPFYQQYNGGMLNEEDDEVYFVGIIDTLINYGFKKQAEHQIKAVIHGSGHGISVTAPDAYAARFVEFCKNIIV